MRVLRIGLRAHPRRRGASFVNTCKLFPLVSSALTPRARDGLRVVGSHRGPARGARGARPGHRRAAESPVVQRGRARDRAHRADRRRRRGGRARGAGREQPRAVAGVHGRARLRPRHRRRRAPRGHVRGARGSGRDRGRVVLSRREHGEHGEMRRPGPISSVRLARHVPGKVGCDPAHGARRGRRAPGREVPPVDPPEFRTVDRVTNSVGVRRHRGAGRGRSTNDAAEPAGDEWSGASARRRRVRVRARGVRRSEKKRGEVA